MEKSEKNKIFNAVFYPLLLVIFMIISKISEAIFDLNFVQYGIYPRDMDSLLGIVTTNFVHSDFNHLLNNSVTLLILGTALFYFYRSVAFNIISWVVLMGGIWTWISAREAYHIGASGLIYGLFSFLLVSGFIRMNKQLISLSFVVVLIYGSMVWGIFPVKMNISYEAHFWGFISGIILAVFYRKQGLQKENFVWEEDEEDDSENQYWKQSESEIEQ